MTPGRQEMRLAYGIGRAAVSCTGLFLVAGCGGSADTTTEPPTTVIARIDVTPAKAELLPGQSQQYSAALYGPTSVLISGPSVTWSVDDGSVAIVSTSGIIQANKPGEITLSARAGTATGTAIVDVKFANAIYILRSANGVTLPAVIIQGVTCNPATGGDPQRITVRSGSFAFYRVDNPNQPSPFFLRPALDIFEECGTSTATYSGGGDEFYTIKGNSIIFQAGGGWAWGTARISNDSIFVRWQGDRLPSDSLNLIYVKQ